MQKQEMHYFFSRNLILRYKFKIKDNIKMLLKNIYVENWTQST